MNRARQGILAQVHRLEELFEQDFAGMRVAQQSAPSRGSRRFRHASFSPSFRGASKTRTRNLEIPGLVLTHHPGMTLYGGMTFISRSRHAKAKRSNHRPPRAAARLVRPPSPQAAVAAAGGRARRSVPGLAVGNHAAADRRQNRRAVFREIPGALARCRRARPRLARRRAADVGRARLLFARAQPACLRGRGGCATMAACFRTPKRACARCRGSGPTPRRRSRRSRSTAAPCRSTAISSAWCRGCSRSRSRCRRPSRVIQQLAATLARPSRAGDEKSRAGDSAQALMDLGASICTPKKPACALCPLNEDCAARARGDQETFPRKAAKKTGELRRGAAFVVTRGDELLVRTRPEKGLLGGMTEVPGSDWLARTGRQGGAEAGAAAERRCALAPQGRRRHPCLHAFSAGARGLHRQRARAHARARGHALGADRDAGRRGAAERHAQGDRARARRCSRC